MNSQNQKTTTKLKNLIQKLKTIITLFWNTLIPRLSTTLILPFTATFIGYNLLLLPLYPIPGSGDFVAIGIYAAALTTPFLLPAYFLLLILELTKIIKFRFTNKFMTKNKFYRIFVQINFSCFVVISLGSLYAFSVVVLGF